MTPYKFGANGGNSAPTSYRLKWFSNSMVKAPDCWCAKNLLMASTHAGVLLFFFLTG